MSHQKSSNVQYIAIHTIRLADSTGAMNTLSNDLSYVGVVMRAVERAIKHSKICVIGLRFGEYEDQRLCLTSFWSTPNHSASPCGLWMGAGSVWKRPHPPGQEKS